jgi:TonB family protein
MAFRALLFSKSPETNSAMTVACQSTGIHAEVCSDIFTAIEKAKTRGFSCLIADWAEQPEASFLLKRARESTPNRNTLAVAIVDNEPTAAEMHDNRLDFLIYRPISAEEADAVLAKACEQMQPSSVEDAPEEQTEQDAARGESSSAAGVSSEQSHEGSSADLTPTNTAEDNLDTESEPAEETQEQAFDRSHVPTPRGALAAVLTLAAVFFLWRSRDVAVYLYRTPEGAYRVLRESVGALFYMNSSGALPVGTAGGDARQDAYFSRGPANSGGPTPSLAIAATESTTPDERTTLPKAPDFPLPTPTLYHQDPPPMHIQRAAIPDSMRNSPPIERPVVVTVNPAQMMPVSSPQPQLEIQSSSNEPVAVSEQAARALLIHSVDPVYPAEAAAQKLHGPVVLQALVGRDGSVEDLKIVRGYFILGRAAIAAVKQWRFQPYNVNGHAASTQTMITINFSGPPG